MEDKGTVNAFANDGSFMELFRKKLEQENLWPISTKTGTHSHGHGTRSAMSAAKGGKADLSLSPHPAQRTGESGKETLSGHVDTEHVTNETSVKQSNDPDLHTQLSTQTTTRPTDLHKMNTMEESEKAESVSASVAVSVSDKDKVIKEQPTGDTSKTVASSVPTQKKYSLLSHVGKRRDGKLSLKTGTVKKQRTSDTQGNKDQDSCSKYMAEVQKYKAHVCGDEDKSRPLVK